MSTRTKIPSATFTDLAVACAEGRAMLPYWQRHPAVAQRDELQARIDRAVLLIERAPYSRQAAAAMRVLTQPEASHVE